MSPKLVTRMTIQEFGKFTFMSANLYNPINGVLT